MMPAMTVVTYNIFGARHRAGLARVVTALAPDVLIVTETPKLPVVWRWQCDQLAREWGLRRAAGGRDAGSTMICVSGRVEVEATTARRLAQPRLSPRRGIVTAQCAVDGVQFGVVGVHLSLLRASRPHEAAAALDVASRLRGPLLLGGDLNEEPTAPCWRLFRDAGLVDHAGPTALTWPSDHPVKRIDALLVRGVVVREHVVPSLPGAGVEQASDHLPVLARVELG